MLARIAVDPSCAVLQESTVQILIKDLQHFIAEYAVLLLEPLLPNMLQFLSCMVHHTVELTCLWASPPVVLALSPYFLPGISSYHIGGIEKEEVIVVSGSVADGHNHSRQTSA